MNIIISKPVIEEKNDIIRLYSDITLGKINKRLFYEYPIEYKEYITDERIDCFLIPILPYAMIASKRMIGEKVVIESKVKVSNQIMSNLKSLYIPILSKNVEYWGGNIEFDMELDYSILENAGGCATGISGGIDSSYTIAKSMEQGDETRKLTHGMFLNMGIYGGYDTEMEKSLEINAQNICKTVGIKYLPIKTNTCLDLYRGAHGPVVPFIMMGTVLSLQKLLSNYLYSVDFSAEEQFFDIVHAARYDWLNTLCFSTQNLRFWPIGLEATRMDKVKLLANYKFSHEHTAVCINSKAEAMNCSVCAKCTETMVELDSIGKLELYDKVFDVNKYKKNIPYYMSYTFMKKWGKEEAATDSVKEYRKRNVHFSLKTYIWALCKYAKRGFRAANPNRIKVEDIVWNEIENNM